MKFLIKYNSHHYSFYLTLAEKIIDNHTDLNKWVKDLGTDDLLIWSKTYNHLMNNESAFYQESALLVTLVIRLFILELDVDNQIELSNYQIKKLLKRFQYAIEMEYAIRKSEKNVKIKYSLITD